MALENLGWLFDRILPRGGAGGAAYSHTFEGSAPADALAREAIQNSVDAGHRRSREAACDVDTRVRVKFRFKTLERKEAEDFRAILRYEELVGRHPGVDSLREKVRLLYVEDYGTAGLLGNPVDFSALRNDFRKLFLELGETGKPAEKGTGGSFGLGKGALVMNSSSRVVVAFTRVDPASDGVEYRLMGFAFFDQHERGGVRHTGRGFFGLLTEDEAGIAPVEGEAARGLAERFAFSDRSSPGMYGTSILLIGPRIQPKQLLHAVETWWWPALIEDRLSVEVLDEGNGEPLYPHPRRRSDLEAFIQAFDVALGKTQIPEGKRFDVSYTAGGRNGRASPLGLGVAGFVRLDAGRPGQERADDGDEADASGLPPGRAPGPGKVALIREPRMVVAYHGYRNVKAAAVGAFVADPDFDPILRKSEPPAHDAWSSESERLAGEKFPEGSDRDASAAVKHLHTRLGAKFREFSGAKSPPPEPGRGLPELERLLGDYLRPKVKEKPTLPPRQGDFHIRDLKLRPHSRLGGRVLYRTEPVISPPTKAGLGMDVVVTLHAWIQEEDSREPRTAAEDAIPLKVSVLEGIAPAGEVQGNGSAELQLRLEPGRETKLRVHIGPVDQLYRVGLTVAVAPKSS
ncbi:MAG: hypothetical protein KatS3mg015_3218 [Fimbriimonadales bacterium]|nr:MAG: hypothetical protein KatS3mg015_3218 [Fimbriimonadales bacterium]